MRRHKVGNLLQQTDKCIPSSDRVTAIACIAIVSVGTKMLPVGGLGEGVALQICVPSACSADTQYSQ